MTSPFIQRLAGSIKANSKAPAQQALPALPMAPVATAGNPSKRYNPFLTALNTDSTDFKDVYGVNRPLAKPMFLGYRDDKALYGGSRLFILY
jgi:hypothetical protein